MQMLYGYDVVADLAPQTPYDEVVKALGGGGETVTDPRQIGAALDRAFAAGRAVPGQRDHRRRARPTRATRSGSDAVKLRRAHGPRTTPRSASSPWRRTPTSRLGPDDPYVDAPARRGDPRPRGGAVGRDAGRRRRRSLGTRHRSARPARRGASSAATGEGEFRMLAVAPAARGRGVGEALVRLVPRPVPRRRRRAVVLSTLAEMTAAHRLYERLGFRRAPELDWSPDAGVDLHRPSARPERPMKRAVDDHSGSPSPTTTPPLAVGSRRRCRCSAPRGCSPGARPRPAPRSSRPALGRPVAPASAPGCDAGRPQVERARSASEGAGDRLARSASSRRAAGTGQVAAPARGGNGSVVGDRRGHPRGWWTSGRCIVACLSRP